ncbi:MAG TPA: fimbria/pilus outer membrane usher protein [Edaphobacter sp.]|nr:fimbria/pilus outer membrane usher protein [Edaphobacter sp.]
MKLWPPRPTRWLACVPFLLCPFAPLLGISQQSNAVSEIADSPTPVQELVAGVTINGHSVSDEARLVRSGQRFYATAAEFADWRLRLPRKPALHFEDDLLYQLDTVDAASCVFDEEHQVLILSVAPAGFAETQMRGHDSKLQGTEAAEPGLFLNHDLELTRTSTGTALASLNEIGFFSKLGVLTTRFVGQDLTKAVMPFRLDTQFVRDYPERMTSLTIGDSVSAVSPWALQVYYSGVRWASKFSTQPSFISYALPSLSGQVTQPSVVDTYINDVKTLSQPVDTGPFSIQDIPVVTGQGDITMVVTDVLGRSQIVTQSYLRATQLLRKGLNAYTYEGGTLRYGYGTAKSGYTSAFLAGTHSRGLTDSLTLDLRGELQGSQQTGGMGVSYGLLPVGLLGGGVVLSHSEQGGGASAYFQLQHTARKYGFSGTGQISSSNFRQLGMDSHERSPSLVAEGEFSRSINTGGSFAIGYLIRSVRSSVARQPDPTQVNFSGANGSINYRLGSRLNLTVAATYSPIQKQGTTANFGFTIPIGRRSLLTGDSTIQKDSSTAFVEYTQELPAGNGYGYRVRTSLADDRGVDVGVQSQTNTGTYEIQVGNTSGKTEYRLSERAGLVFFHQSIMRSRWLDESFGVVQVPNAKGVEVFANNQYIAKTDRRGFVLVPDMVPYINNAVRIDESGVPLDLQMDLSERQIVPLPRTGVFVKFADSLIQGAVLTLVTEDGEPVPLGASVTANGSVDVYQVALHGEVFLSEVSFPTTVHVKWETGHCEAKILRPAKHEPLPKIGPIACRASL